MHHRICGFTSHCTVVCWSPFLYRHEYTCNKLIGQCGHIFFHNGKEASVFCQLVHTSHMAHQWCFVHITFSTPCWTLLCVQRTWGYPEMPSLCAMWLLSDWGISETLKSLVGMICGKPFGGLGSLLCFCLSSCRGNPSISGTMGCTVWVQFKQGWFRVCRVSLVSHVIFAHLARSLVQENNIPNSSSETTVPLSVMIAAELS